MLEKLLENWLDNASERSYQAVFVQMLVAEGFQVLHSTRHCTLEFGKDVLAISPDGVGCVFQLKGDPRRKMTVESFKAIQAQVVQMMAQRPSFPGFPQGPHRAYLVSNGEFNEEVQIAVHELNNSGYIAKMELWSRGKLLDMCKQHGLSLWPSEIRDNRALLEIYMASPRDPLSLDTLDGLLSSILALNVENSLNGQELRRAVSSASWATGICLSRFYEERNHYAVIFGWMMCWSLIGAAVEKHAHKSVRHAGVAQEQCINATLDSLSELWNEVSSREHLSQGNPMVDADVYGWRVAALLGLLSTLYFANKTRKLLDNSSASALERWLVEMKEQAIVWGEGAVSQLLPWILALCSVGQRARAESELAVLAEIVISRNQSDSGDAMATPHYDYEEVCRDSLGLREGTVARLSERETFAGSSFTADVLLRLLVQMDQKQVAKDLWADFSRLGHRSLLLSEERYYWHRHVQVGTDLTRCYPLTYEYSTLVEENRVAANASWLVPYVGTDLWLVMLWWQVCPHRVNTRAVASLADRLLLLSA